MRLALLSGVLAAGGLFVAACGDGGAATRPLEAPAGTARTAASPPVVAPPGAIVPLSAAGSALYVRGARLWIGRLDGSGERDVTPEEAAADAQLRTLRYAGAATIDGRVFAHFSTAFGEPFDPAGGSDSMTLAVYRVALDGGAPTPLLRFNVTRQAAFGAASHASVSPDGRYVAWTDAEGLHLFDTLAQTDASRHLLSNRRRSPTNTPGNVYVDPVWAPAGGWLAVTRHAQGDPTDAAVDFVRPLEPITEYTGDAGGRVRWNADGARVCIEVVGEARVGVMGVGERRFEPLVNDVGGTAASSCAWSPDGRQLAVGYIDEAAGETAQRFRIYNVADRGDVPVSEMAPGLHGAGVTAWLPDGSGIIVVHGVGEERPQSKILRLDGTVHRLAVDADVVLATFP